jgi:hypothetical protein
MKSFRSYLTKLDRLKQSPSNLGTCQPTELEREMDNNSLPLTHQNHPLNSKLSRALFATTLLIGSHLLAVMPANSNPVPTPAQPSPIVPTRTILNGSFEQPVITNWVAPSGTTPGSSTTGSATSNIAGGNVPESYNSLVPIIWRSTESGINSGGQYDYKNAVEVWRGTPTGNGSQEATSGAGVQFAELNGSDNAALYQDVCILPGETVGWSLKHAVRKAGDNPTNIMQVSITDPLEWTDKTPPATKLYSSPQLSTTYNDHWQAKSGSWVSNISSIQPLRFAFQAIQGSIAGNNSYGNFIDDVQLRLSPLIDFLPTNGGNVNLASTTEGNTTNYYYLSLRINGKMQSGGSVTINLTGLNSTRHFTLGTVLKGSAAVTGLSASKSETGNQITLNIPAGTYDPNSASNYIHIPIDFSDTITQPNDNLTFTLSTPAGGGTSGGDFALSIVSTGCFGTPRTTVNTKLKDDDYVKMVSLPLTLAAK